MFKTTEAVIDFLREVETDRRITNGDAWLVWLDDLSGWRVYQKAYGKHKTTTLYAGEYFDDALKALARSA